MNNKIFGVLVGFIAATVLAYVMHILDFIPDFLIPFAYVLYGVYLIYLNR